MLYIEKMFKIFVCHDIFNNYDFKIKVIISYTCVWFSSEQIGNVKKKVRSKVLCKQGRYM